MAARANVPDSGGGEKHLVMRTYKIVLLDWTTDITNIVEHPVFDSNFNKGSQNGPNSLY
jgi:hypothetical protein